MFTFLIVLISIIAVVMTLIILLQSGRGGGLAGIASGGATTQILGNRQAPDFLERATWTLATAFIVLTILSNFVIGPDEAATPVIQQQQGQTQQQAPVLPGPPGDAAPAGNDGNSDAGSAESGGAESGQGGSGN
jgi:preprotein translocase subunit SecG